MRRGRRIVGLGLITGVLLGFGVTQSPTGATPGAPDRTEEVRALLAAGKAEEAFDAAEIALEYEPRSVALLDLASRAAEAIDWKDEALYYAGLALEAAGSAPEFTDLVEDLRGRIAESFPDGIPGEALLHEFAQERFALAQACASKKLYLNAVDLYESLADSILAGDASSALDDLFEDKKALAAMLEAGADLPPQPVTRLSRERIGQMDRKHPDWAHAYDAKSENYRIRTDMGYEVSVLASRAMEQIGRFYRQIFHHKERGGRMPRCEVRIYKSRAEFDEQESAIDPSLSVRAFYVPVQNRVAVYNPASDGLPASYLWSTLFHEASHQFTHAVAAGLVPGWLNEGTASYFEGARILPSGYVETNRIPPLRARSMRIRSLMRQAGMDAGPSLREVVGFMEKGSYPAEYYPIGWSLVYFLQNFEDEKCERVYVPIFQKILKAYSKGGASHDPVDRFVDYFVRKAKQPGVETFEDFEKRWSDWMEETLDLYYGPPDRADRLEERARRQVAHGKTAAAVESYRWALEKRPGDPVAHEGLGECLGKLGQKDAAALQYRKAMVGILARGDLSAKVPGMSDTTWEELMARCEKGLRRIHAALADGSRETTVGFAAKALEDASKSFEDGYSLASLRLIDRSLAWTPGNPALLRLRDRIRKVAAVDTRRWRRLRIDEGLDYWEAGESFAADGDGLRGEAKGLAWATYREALPEAMRLEATVEPQGHEAGALFGLILGSSERGGTLILTVSGEGKVSLANLGESLEVEETIGTTLPAGGGSFELAAEVEGQRIRLFAGGKAFASLESKFGDLQPQAGVCVRAGAARFRDLRVRF